MEVLDWGKCHRFQSKLLQIHKQLNKPFSHLKMATNTEWKLKRASYSKQDIFAFKSLIPSRIAIVMPHATMVNADAYLDTGWTTNG